MKFRKMSVLFVSQPGISEIFGRMESALCLSSGPVHTYADIFESATFSFRIRLSSTRIRRIRKQSRKCLIRSPEWKFLNPITFRIRVDGRIRIFSDTMSSQNWRQYLPRNFKHGRRSKANSFSLCCLGLFSVF